MAGQIASPARVRRRLQLPTNHPLTTWAAWQKADVIFGSDGEWFAASRAPARRVTDSMAYRSATAVERDSTRCATRCMSSMIGMRWGGDGLFAARHVTHHAHSRGLYVASRPPPSTGWRKLCAAFVMSSSVRQARSSSRTIATYGVVHISGGGRLRHRRRTAGRTPSRRASTRRGSGGLRRASRRSGSRDGAHHDRPRRS